MSKCYRNISALMVSVVQDDEIVVKVIPEVTFYSNRQTSPDGFE